jgi:hypothetical protein
MSSLLLQPLLQPLLRSPLLPPSEVGGMRLGPELVPNGDFSGGATGWTLGAGWSVAAGQLVATAAAQDTFTQSGPVITSGETYLVQIACTAYTSGGWKLLFEGGVNPTGDHTSAGVFTGIATATASGSIYVWANSLLSASFDNISVRKIY